MRRRLAQRAGGCPYWPQHREGSPPRSHRHPSADERLHWDARARVLLSAIISTYRPRSPAPDSGMAKITTEQSTLRCPATAPATIGQTPQAPPFR